MPKLVVLVQPLHRHESEQLAHKGRQELEQQQEGPGEGPEAPGLRELHQWQDIFTLSN